MGCEDGPDGTVIVRAIHLSPRAVLLGNSGAFAARMAARAAYRARAVFGGVGERGRVLTAEAVDVLPERCLEEPARQLAEWTRAPSVEKNGRDTAAFAQGESKSSSTESPQT
jgi:hypothetical protein